MNLLAMYSNQTLHGLLAIYVVAWAHFSVKLNGRDVNGVFE